MRLHEVVALFAIFGAAHAATADQWRSRSIYQVMTDRFALTNGSTTSPCDPALGKYCGGSWQGITNRLDYIQDMGFNAVWISPVEAQLPEFTTDLAAYHGYWPQNLYVLNEKFGTESDLKDLIKALHDRGMYVMFDIVANHMAIASNYTDVDFNDFVPFNTTSYFHTPYCSVYSAGASQIDCWLGDDVVPLVDLRTEDEDVQKLFNNWISNLVSEYNIDGLRLDSAANINMEFFKTFCDSAAVFCMGEVYNGDPSVVCPYQEVMDSTLNYPMYWPLTRAFANSSGNMHDLADEIGSMISTCKDTTVLGSFSENQDVPRFASYTQDITLASNVLTYIMLADGVPIVYEGQEQHLNGAENPYNREAVWLTGYDQSSTLYKQTTTLNLLRSRAIQVASNYTTYNNWVIYNTSDTIVTRKGFTNNQIITVLTNDGSDGKTRSFSLDPTTSGFTSNAIITDVLSCTNSTTNGTGWLDVDIKAGAPKAYYPAVNLVGSKICEAGTTTSPTSTSGPSSTSAAPTSTHTKKGAAGKTYQRHEVFSVIAGCVILALVQYVWL